MKQFEKASTNVLKTLRHIMLNSIALTSVTADDETPVVIQIHWDEIIKMINDRIPDCAQFFTSFIKTKTYHNQWILDGTCSLVTSEWLKDQQSTTEMPSFQTGVKTALSQVIKELSLNAVTACYALITQHPIDYLINMQFDKIKLKRGTKWKGDDNYELRIVGLLNLLSGISNDFLLESLVKINPNKNTLFQLKPGCTKLYNYHYWFLQLGEYNHHIGRYRKMPDNSAQWEESGALTTMGNSNPLPLLTLLLTKELVSLHDTYLDQLDEGCSIWYNEPLAELKKQFNSEFLTTRWVIK